MTRSFIVALSVVAAALASPTHARPRLAVMVIFDQLRSAELDRYAAFFGPGGFGGLDGARFDAHYAYAGTETGPGHATLATGANPSTHGVATNYWFEGRRKRYAVDDDTSLVLGSAEPGGRGPRSLLAPTLADVMKAESQGRAKVITLSHKDRSAILSGGQSADLAVWYDAQQGRYTTSTVYVKALPPWLADKGARLPAATMASARWSPLPLPKALAVLAPPDDREGEGAHEGVTRTFPHDISLQPELLRKKLYRLTPQAMDDLFTLALAAVDEAKLGQDEEPDLLVVSVSTTDYIGHNFGPDSLEQLDTIRRADVALRAFVQGVERRVGARNFVLALSSDHGAPPLPAPALNERWPHGIVVASDVVDAAEAAVARALPDDKEKRVLGFAPPQLFVDTTDLPPAAARKVLEAVTSAVERLDGIANVYDLARPGRDEDALEPLMRASAFPARAAPLFVRQKPRVVFLENRDKRGTDHGSPYLYDRRVPVIVAGPGVRKGRYSRPIDPRDVAPTLAFLLGVPPPDLCEGKAVSAVGELAN